MSRNSILIVALVVSGLCLIVIGLVWPRYSATPSPVVSRDTTTVVPSTQSQVGESERLLTRQEFLDNASAVFTSCAKRNQISDATVDVSVVFLKTELQTAISEQKILVPPNWSSSLEGLVLLEAPVLRNNAESATHVGMRFIVLWILDALNRPAPTKDGLAQVKEQFENLLTYDMECLGEHLRNSLGNRTGYETEIQRVLKDVRALAMQKFQVLQDDPIFPCFKRPWTENEITGIRKASDGRRQATMILPGYGKQDPVHYYTGRLRAIALDQAGLFFENISVTQAYSIMEQNKWWGKCLWGTSSSGNVFDSAHAWPFYGRVQPTAQKGQAK